MHPTALSWRVPLYLLAIVLVFSCIGSPEDVVSPETPKDESGPPEAQIKQDIIGRSFLYFHRGSDREDEGYMTGWWTAELGGLRNLVILKRYPDMKNAFGDRADEIHVMVTLEDADQIIRGPLVFQYLKLEKGWKLFYMGARDGDDWHDFSFERIRKSDGKRTVELSPANPPPGPSRFTPRSRTQPMPGKSGPVIQAW